MERCKVNLLTPYACMSPQGSPAALGQDLYSMHRAGRASWGSKGQPRFLQSRYRAPKATAPT